MLYFVQHPARLLRWNYLLILFSHSYSFYLFLSLYSFELESQETFAQKRERSISYAFVPFAFDFFPLSSAISESPASASRARNERMPGVTDPAGSLLPGYQARARQYF
jgi:hypothetical protein